MKIAFVGLGSIGKRHLKNFLEIEGEGKHEVYLIDPSDENLKTGVMINEKAISLSAIEELEEQEIDLAFICTPNHLHVENALFFLKRGSSVFVEKPLSFNDDELKLLEAQENKKLMVGCNLRFHPGATGLKKNLERIGKVTFAKATFGHYLPNWRPNQDYKDTYSAKKSEGGGIFWDAIHEPDYLSWLLGKAVKIQGEKLKISELEIETDDFSKYVLTHESGARSEVQVDYIRQDKLRECELIGEKGTLIWRSVGKSPEKISIDLFLRETGLWENIYQNDSYQQNDQFLEEMKYFLRRVQSQDEFMNGIKEASDLIRILDSL